MNESWPKRETRKSAKRAHPLVELLWAAGNIEQSKVEFEKLRADRLRPTSSEMGFLERALRIVVIPLRYRCILTLDYLDSLLGQLQETSDLLCFRKELQNRNQFWDAYSEIECAALASKSYPIELKPKISGRVIDLKVSINDTPILIEVRSARPPSSGFAKSKIPNILKEKAVQFSTLPRRNKTPCLRAKCVCVLQHSRAKAMRGLVLVLTRSAPVFLASLQ
jgi:hypothetical protein